MYKENYYSRALFVISLLVIMLISMLSGCGTTATSPTATPQTPAAKVVAYPTKDITLIVPTSPGGGYDTYSRLLAQYMPRYLPKQVNMIVKNVPGGEWNIGIGEINRAKPDGYTIGIFNIPGNVVNQIMGGVDYDLTKMAWLGSITDTVYVGALSPKSKFKSIKDMQASKEEVKVGVVGLASGAGLGSLLAFEEMGIKAKYISHAGSTEAVMAAVRGDVDYVQYPYPTLRKFIVDSHQLNPVAVFYATRHKELPDVPTIKELGFESLLDVVQAQYQVAATPGIPPEIAIILRDAFQKAVKDPDFVKKMDAAGQPAHPSTDVEAAKNIDTSLKTFTKYKGLIAGAMK